MAKPMTKTQLVAALAEEMGADKKAAGAALEAVCALSQKKFLVVAQSLCQALAKSIAANVQSAWFVTLQLASSSKKTQTKLSK